MSGQNRFLLAGSATTNSANKPQQSATNSSDVSDENNQHSVDTDFDSYWEEEARNPHRNRIRIGRQYQATVPPLLKGGERDHRSLEDLETLSFCPKKSARVSDAELDHYFTVAKSLNLFASLVETRSLLGRDVTIADLNHIRNKEGLSLASVIQPPPARQTASYSNQASNLFTTQSLNTTTTLSSTTTQANQQQSPQKSPPSNCERTSSVSLSSSSSPRDMANSLLESQYTFNQPLMKALSHFISLHHPCHHDRECKKLLKDTPLEDESVPSVSITAGNLRQGSSSFSSKSETKPGRSRSSLKQAAYNAATAAAVHMKDEPTTSTSQSDKDHQDQDPQIAVSGDNVQSPSFDDWTREEVELFSKAIEVCGKNFSSIKREFLPSKSVRSIVEYYYIGSRDVSENKKKSNPPVEANDGCSSPEKALANNNGQGGGGSSSAGGKSGPSSSVTGSGYSSNTSSSRNATSKNDSNNHSKTLTDSTEETKQSITNQDEHHSTKTVSNSKNLKSCNAPNLNGSGNNVKSTKNIDPRMSVYNFDEEFKEDSPIRFDCPRPGAEVKPLKAKPIIPNSLMDSDATNSNVGSLKFFMDGQLILKLNACQEQQEGIEKCHWVQSGDKVINASRQKRYTKRTDKSLSDSNQNGSQSNSVVSSFQDDDSKNDDLTGDEDSKESMNSFNSSSNLNLPQQKNSHGSPVSKRIKIKSEHPNSMQQQHQVQLTSPINYNRMAVNNRMKERSDNLDPSPVTNQATAAAMPWLQANSYAVAAALLSGLPFPPSAGNLIDSNAQSNVNSINMSAKPMDLSLEHSAQKSIQKSSSRSKARPKNN